MLPLILALMLARGSGTAEVGAGWRARMLAPAAEPAIAAWAAERSLTIAPVAGGVELRATWKLRAPAGETWFSGQVLGAMPGLRVEKVALDGKPVATAARPSGVVVAARVAGRATLEVVAFVPGDPSQAPLRLELLAAARGHAEAGAPAGLVASLSALPAEEIVFSDPRPVDGPAAVVDAAAVSEPEAATPALRVGPVFWTGAGRLDLGYAAAPGSPAGRQTVVVARAGVGLTVGDAELRGRARLVWEVRQGALEAVGFTASGLGADVQITGAGVRAVERSGDAVRVLLQAPVQGRLELEATWTVPIARGAESRVELPRIRFDDVFRSEATLQLARDGEVEAVPGAEGWTPSAGAALPGWGQGLVEGAPTAAFTGGAASAGHLDLLRFVPIEGPPVVVDVAAYTIAASREGRALIRAHYEVRNERAAALRIRPPAGFEVLGVRVGGETAMPARDKDGAWRVPLRRSVETVSGLLSFPVEVALLGDQAVPWDRRERRALPLPQLDAPVAVTRATLHLPPGYRSRLRAGEGDVVAGFTRGEGITYGLGVGAVGAAEADALFQGAVRKWLDNDFGAAQAELDKLRGLGARSENIDRLQANLDVISGKSGAKQDGGVQRRIREQAKARALGEQRAQEELRKEAEKSRQAGDYERAESQYKAAIAVGDRLAQLEQSESVEQQVRNESLKSELASNADEGALKRRSGYRTRSKAARFGKGSYVARQEAEGDGVADKESVAKPGPSGGKLGGDVADASRGPTASGTTAAEPGGGEVADSKDRPAPPPPAVNFDAEVLAGANVRPDGTAVVKRPPADLPKSGQVLDTKFKTDESIAPPADPAATTPAQGTRDRADLLSGAAVAVTGASAPEETADAPTSAAEDTGAALVDEAPAVGRTFEAVSDIAVVQRVSGRAAGRRAVRRARRGEAPEARARPDAAKNQNVPAGLPAPVVTASALSVVVPTLGEAVLYQRLLLPWDPLESTCRHASLSIL